MRIIDAHAQLERLRSEEDGQTMIEYAGMALLVSISVILILSAIGLDLAETFDEVENALGIGAANDVPDDPGVSDATPPTGVN